MHPTRKTLLTGVGLGALLAVPSWLLAAGVPFPFTNDTVADATQVNGNFDHVTGRLDALETVVTPKGLLPPNVTTAQRDAIASPAGGLMVFNATTKEMNVYDGTRWRSMSSGFSVRRLNQTLAANVTLHAVTPTVDVPVSGLPANTKAVIVGLFYLHSGGANHGYVDVNVLQKGKGASETARFRNMHYNDYYNSDYYELVIPWDPDGPQTVTLSYLDTYNTSTANSYDVYLRGAITAN